ncbi:MAG: mannose-1-phosphate guanylyltransferase [Alicyclobacillus herbarius]|uniref:mannose-1-phosphate guanylyltransferase n=1 Tax=Alicyclobacillus herbarius TaxID=122960 RepID=UPI0023579368|nr:mannose-1-phosphate guanylyltransferase [Alicyclobacillus herbarius]MCL6631005.1 mannose-1-phosphate guanylyltransferase [Alicyclobacillus herbarius]
MERSLRGSRGTSASTQAAVILAGGAGERLFPYSKAELPKQFLPLVSNRSMLQETYQRLRKRFPANDIYIVTQDAFVDTVLEQLPAVTGSHILIEPARRDTAGAIALSLAEIGGDYDVVLFCPADHHIVDSPEWDEALATALLTAAEERRITLFGIVPNYPETGYGYIEYERSDDPVCPVVRFHEKPDRETALRMVRSGRYLWNCGIFAIPCDTGMQAIRRHLPEHALLFELTDRTARTEVFLSLPKVSIDYGLLEREHAALAVVPAFFAWNDLGSWTALERVLNRDENGNYLFGRVKSLKTNNSIVFAPKHEVFLYDVSDLLVVCHEQQVLVTNKAASSDMKQWLPQLTNGSSS